MPVQYLYEYLDDAHNLYAFLGDFPEVTTGQALEAIEERVKTKRRHPQRQRLCERHTQIHGNARPDLYTV